MMIDDTLVVSFAPASPGRHRLGCESSDHKAGWPRSRSFYQPSTIPVGEGETMLLVRDIMYCKPGKVLLMVEKLLALAKLSEKAGRKMRVMTDVSAERYWTVV